MKTNCEKQKGTLCHPYKGICRLCTSNPICRFVQKQKKKKPHDLLRGLPLSPGPLWGFFFEILTAKQSEKISTQPSTRKQKILHINRYHVRKLSYANLCLRAHVLNIHCSLKGEHHWIPFFGASELMRFRVCCHTRCHWKAACPIHRAFISNCAYFILMTTCVQICQLQCIM